MRRGALSSLVLGLFASGALALPVQSPVVEGTAQEQATESVREDRGAKRLLHLRDGRVLRVRAREVAATREGAPSTWEVRQKREWIALPPGSVERVALEKDVLKSARRLERELGRKAEPGRRVAYASWLFEQGLTQEGATELNAILRDDVDQPQALALIGTVPLQTNLPRIDLDPARRDASVSSFLRAASRSTPLGTEVAVERLRAASESLPGLEARLFEELHAPSTNRRTFAARAMRRLFPGQEVRPLLRRAILDASGDVRTEAALALRDVQDEAVLVPAVRALGSKHARVRENAIQAMATMGYPGAVQPLVSHLSTVQSGAGSGRPPHSNIFVGRQFAYVQDFDVEVAQGAAVADPIINTGVEGAVLDAAVLSTSQVRVSELAATRRALGRLTGQNPGNSVRAWQSWWNENGDTWMAGSPPGPPVSPDSPDR